MGFRADQDLRLLFGSLFFWMLGVGLYEGLLPIYARQLGASPVELGTLFTLRHLALAAGFLIGWAVADRLSRRTLMFASWFAGLPVPLALALAPTYLWLLPGLLLYELTYFALPAIHAYITERVAPTELASAFGAMHTLTSIAFLVSPTAGGVLADRFGIRPVLVIAFALFAVSTVLVVRVRRDGPGTLPVGGAPRVALRDLRPVGPALLVYVAVSFVALVTVPFLPPYLREVRGLSLSEIGVLASLQALGAVLLTPVVGRLGDRVGHARVLVGQLGAWIAGILLTAYAGGAWLAIGAALRCRSPLTTLSQAMVAAASPRAILGRTFALAGIATAVLAAVGAFVGGYAYRANPIYPLLVSIATAAVVALALARPSRR